MRQGHRVVAGHEEMQHSTLNTQRSTHTTAHSTLNTQHSTLHTPRYTLKPAHSILNTQHATPNTQHSTLNTQQHSNPKHSRKLDPKPPPARTRNAMQRREPLSRKMAHIRQSRPDSGLGLQSKVLKISQVVAFFSGKRQHNDAGCVRTGSGTGPPRGGNGTEGRN
jgi:hypothetical protein